MTIQFGDKTVTYDVFLNDLADALSERMHKGGEPEYVSQNEAFRRFGRSNVERWRKSGKIVPCKRSRKLEYKLRDLQRLQDSKQDYFINCTDGFIISNG